MIYVIAVFGFQGFIGSEGLCEAEARWSGVGYGGQPVYRVPAVFAFGYERDMLAGLVGRAGWYPYMSCS
jgi:hypothetical protein